jgi:membrane protein DedA with SNARE-associated domain
MAPVLASLSGSLTSFIGDYGLWAVFLLMLVDAVLPAASELVMVYGGAIAAGAFASQTVSFTGHGWDAYIAISLAGTIGYVIGSLMGWALGRYGGRPLVERHGKWLHLNAEKLDRAERWFAKWETWGVFVGRLLPVVRSFVSVPAGLFEVRLGPYTILTLLGSAIWCFALAGVGFGLGSSYETFHHAWRFADYLVVAAIAAAAFYVILRRRRTSTLKRRASDSAR